MKSGLKYSRIAGIFLCLVFSVSAAETNVVKKLPRTVVPVAQNAKWTTTWWVPRHEEKVRRIKRGNVDLLMIGDSITHGWETRGKAVWNTYYKNRKAVNLGFSGDRTEHVLWRLQHGEIDGISPRLVVLMIGTNNTGQKQKDSAQDTAAGIQAILKELRTRLPRTRVLLLGVFPCAATAESPLRKVNDQINEIISGYADNKRVFYLNINKKFLDENGILSKEIMPDLLHPNEKGYQIWAKAMEPTISRLISRTPLNPSD